MGPDPRIFFYLLILPGWFFWVYILSSILLRRCASLTPVPLFWISIGSVLSQNALAIFLLNLFGEPIGILLLIVSLTGYFGLLTQLYVSIKQRKEVAAFRKSYPLPKFQFWLQDVLISVFTFGLQMAISTHIASRLFAYPSPVAALFAFSGITTMIGIWITSDLLRREKNPPRPSSRGLTLLGLLLTCTYLLPFYFIA